MSLFAIVHKLETGQFGFIYPLQENDGFIIHLFYIGVQYSISRNNIDRNMNPKYINKATQRR